MNKVINCSDEAIESIDRALERIQELKKALEEKRGDSLGIKYVLSSLLYMVGMIVCIYLTLMYKQVVLAPFDELTGYIIVIIAGFSSTLFLGVLLLRNFLEGKYYKVIFHSEQKVNYLTRNLQQAKIVCENYFGLLDGSTNHKIELGNNFYIEIDNIERQTMSLEKRKSVVISNVLTILYYVAAITVGAIFVLKIQDGVVNTIRNTIIALNINVNDAASSWAQDAFSLCSVAGVLIGPFISKYYFEQIKLIPLTDGLVFLIAGSGFLGFIAALIVVGLIAVVIGLVCAVVSFVVEMLAGLIALLIIIAIIVGLFGGG